MGAKEFFTAIDMLETYNKIMNIEDKKSAGTPLGVDTRELGRYRSYVYREKMLKREILELTEQRLRVERLVKKDGEIFGQLAQDDYKRGRSKMIDLWLELSKVMLKKRRLEQQLEQIPSAFVRKVVRHRYFTDDTQRLHTWAQTACELGLPMTGVQLRSVVTNALKTGEL